MQRVFHFDMYCCDSGRFSKCGRPLRQELLFPRPFHLGAGLQHFGADDRSIPAPYSTLFARDSWAARSRQKAIVHEVFLDRCREGAIGELPSSALFRVETMRLLKTSMSDVGRLARFVTAKFAPLQCRRGK